MGSLTSLKFRPNGIILDWVFWGGIDRQHVLTFGTADDVAEAVKGRRKDLGKGGGFVQASVHNLQSEVPPENIVAMFETALGRR